jgi:hypothetical protein
MDAGTAYAPILLRAALALRLIAALMALADSADEQALRRAMGDAAVTSYVADARPAGAYDDKWAGTGHIRSLAFLMAIAGVTLASA